MQIDSASTPDVFSVGVDLVGDHLDELVGQAVERRERAGGRRRLVSTGSDRRSRALSRHVQGRSRYRELVLRSEEAREGWRWSSAKSHRRKPRRRSALTARSIHFTLQVAFTLKQASHSKTLSYLLTARAALLQRFFFASSTRCDLAAFQALLQAGLAHHQITSVLMPVCAVQTCSSSASVLYPELHRTDQSSLAATIRTCWSVSIGCARSKKVSAL